METRKIYINFFWFLLSLFSLVVCVFGFFFVSPSFKNGLLVLFIFLIFIFVFKYSFWPFAAFDEKGIDFQGQRFQWSDIKSVNYVFRRYPKYFFEFKNGKELEICFLYTRNYNQVLKELIEMVRLKNPDAFTDRKALQKIGIEK